ncbi:MAG TPA: VWA domain-containing protein [Acidobacteriota bacterium]|nr:VWA domain-containing protein [Acidobacteriota bacterium]
MIEFTNPAALWLLTLSIPLILLYLLKRRRRELIVPSTVLWKQVLEDMRAETPFQKLRSSLLLMLQLLILVLITAILSAPQFVSPASLSRRWILVIDCSASMKAKDINPSRFESAKDQLLEKLNEIPASDTVLIVGFSSETSIIQQFTEQFDQARDKLESLKPEDVPGDWPQLLKVLEPLVKDNPPPRLIIASDFANIPSSQINSIPFDPIVVGKSGENLGITRVACKPITGTENKQSLLYQVKNFTKQNVAATLSLAVDENVIDAFEVELKADQTFERTAELTVHQISKVKINVEPDDIFPIDNEFILFVEPSPSAKVELQYENTFLRKAIEILPSIQLRKDGDIHVAKIQNANDVQAAGIYFLQTSGSAVETAIHWNDGHPILRFVDPAAWQVRNAGALIVPPGGISLVEISTGTIAYAIEDKGLRKIFLGFVLEDSNLPSLAGFPLFLQNSIHWIHENQQGSLASLTGGALRIEGAYQVDGKNGYANFANAGESSIYPNHPATKSGSNQTLTQRKTDVAEWFLILVTGFVILEWWAFHRRIDS